ncbi:MAG: hypothetical protein PHE50_04415 [Dehalococcoidales bacterium]|nr:hypothetical protein [Dehalococcoidales bacterium]
MKTGTLLVIVVGIVLAISVIAVWFVPSLESYMIGNTTWNGISKTMKVLNGNIIYSLDEIPPKSEDSILLTIPSLAFAQHEQEQLKQFVLQGGTLLIADDYGSGNDILSYLGLPARFNGNEFLDPLFCMRNPSLPKIVNFSRILVAQGITVSVFNHATVIDNVADEFVLAWSSPTSYLDVNGNNKQDINEPSGMYPVAARMPFGNGTIIMVSDPSILINSMINRYDNLEFVKTLIGQNGGADKTVLFDASHLAETPLDVSKRGLGEIRKFVSKPYPTLALLGVVFISITLILRKRGGAFGG